MTLTVGQTLYYVPRDRRGEPHHVAVKKVGRKWAQISDHLRIDINTLYADGGDYSPPGRCYLSEQVYKDEVLFMDAWRELRNLFDRNSRPPIGVTLNQITNARRALFPTPKDPV